MSSASANHDPSLGNAQGAASAVSGTIPNPNGDGTSISLQTLGPNELMNLLKHLPGVFSKLAEQGNLKEDAAQTLSNLAQANFTPQQHHAGGPQGNPFPGMGTLQSNGTNMMADPGPSSHPRGPPNLGQLAAANTIQSKPMSDTRTQQQQAEDEGPLDDDEDLEGSPKPATNTTPGRRGGRSSTMGSDEWSRQRKDNHKEVERRRRGNINEGINELGRIVPSGSGEKAKGAILSRAVQYIHHLKENEARNIEKWTLEKLLMDQAMGDLQAQLEEVRRLWEEERLARQRAENELDVLRGVPRKPEAEKRGAEDTDQRGEKRQRVE